MKSKQIRLGIVAALTFGSVISAQHFGEWSSPVKAESIRGTSSELNTALNDLPIGLARAVSPTEPQLPAAQRRFGPCRFSSSNSVEPDGGTWRTWVIESPRQFTINAPPYASEEIAELLQLQFDRGAAARENVSYSNWVGAILDRLGDEYLIPSV